MTKAEWFKYDYRRFEILKDCIIDGNVQDVNGKVLDIENSQENRITIDDFYTQGSSQKSTAFKLKLKNDQFVKSDEIGKFPALGGKGIGAGATGTTAAGESLQCLYLAAMVREGVNKPFEHYTAELLKKYNNARYCDVDVDFDKMMNCELAWHHSAYVSGKYLIEHSYVNKNHVLHRGSRAMKKIYSLKNDAFRADGQPPLMNDKWNPGDIWAIDKNLPVLTNSNIFSTDSIESYNGSILRYFMSKKMVGISLKQISSLDRNAKAQEFNVAGGAEIGQHKYTKVTLSTDSSSMRPDIFSSKHAFIYFDGSSRMDIRPTRAMGAINVEIQGKGARGGRAGYGQIQYACEKFLGAQLYSNMSLNSAARDVKNLSNRETEDFISNIMMVHPNADRSEIITSIRKSELDKLHSLIGAAAISAALTKKAKTDKRSADEFITYLVNYAGSKQVTSSAYVKISAA